MTRYAVCVGPVYRGVSFAGLQSNADGRSEVRLPTRGRSHLWVIPQDLALSPVGPIEVVVPLTRDSLEVSVPAARTVTVLVKDRAGPVQDAEVELVEKKGDAALKASAYKFSVRAKTVFGSKGTPWLWQRSQTDGKGEVRLCLRIGHDPAKSSFWLCVKSPGDKTQVARLDPARDRQIVILNE